MLAALVMWSLTRDADASSVCDSPCGAFCEGLNESEPEGAPWRLDRMRLLENPERVCWCECCDVTGDRAIYDIFPVAAVAATARPVAPAATAEPTEEPTAEATEEPAVVPTEEPIAEPTEEPIVVPTEEPTAEPTEEPTVAPRATETESEAGAGATARRIVKKPDGGRNCIPGHAAAPVRLCPTHSGSGWWIYDSRSGKILRDGEGQLVHVPFVELLPAGRALLLSSSTRLTAEWTGDHVRISTRYADGKAYVFAIFPGGRVAHWEW